MTNIITTLTSSYNDADSNHSTVIQIGVVNHKVGSLEDHLKGEKIRLLPPTEYNDIEEEYRVFF